MWCPRPGEAADLDLIRTSAADRWVKFAPCGRASGTPARLEPADPFPQPTLRAGISAPRQPLPEAVTSVGPAKRINNSRKTLEPRVPENPWWACNSGARWFSINGWSSDVHLSILRGLGLETLPVSPCTEVSCPAGHLEKFLFLSRMNRLLD